jgi:DNA primase large subunit
MITVNGKNYDVPKCDAMALQGQAMITQGKHCGKIGIVTKPNDYGNVIFYSEAGGYPYRAVLKESEVCLIN